MISQDFIGKKYSPISFKVTKNKLVSFASATGQNSPIYFDIKAAKDHGYKTMIAPPTFLTVISMEQDQPYKYLEELNIPLDRLFHAAQEYNYYMPIYLGDTITMTKKIEDIYDKKNGTLYFISFLSNYVNHDDIEVAQSLSTLVVRSNA